MSDFKCRHEELGYHCDGKCGEPPKGYIAKPGDMPKQ